MHVCKFQTDAKEKKLGPIKIKLAANRSVLNMGIIATCSLMQFTHILLPGTLVVITGRNKITKNIVQDDFCTTVVVQCNLPQLARLYWHHVQSHPTLTCYLTNISVQTMYHCSCTVWTKFIYILLIIIVLSIYTDILNLSTVSWQSFTNKSLHC